MNPPMVVSRTGQQIEQITEQADNENDGHQLREYANLSLVSRMK